MDRNWATVMEVARAIGIEPAPELMVEVGSLMQRAYAQQYGKQPPKPLRPKTRGGGSHCIAIYPPEMHGMIGRALRERGRADDSQRDLFGYEQDIRTSRTWPPQLSLGGS